MISFKLVKIYFMIGESPNPYTHFNLFYATNLINYIWITLTLKKYGLSYCTWIMSLRPSWITFLLIKYRLQHNCRRYLNFKIYYLNFMCGQNSFKIGPYFFISALLILRALLLNRINSPLEFSLQTCTWTLPISNTRFEPSFLWKWLQSKSKYFLFPI